MKHPSLQLQLFRVIVLLLAVACQGRGRVHEAPSAAYPDAEPSLAPESPFSTAPEPAPDNDGDPAPPELSSSARSSEDEERSAPSEARPESAAALGRGRATTDAPAHERDDSRSGALSPRSLPEQRPGLATHWGEARYSPARPVDFERSAQSPAAVVQLHYDDRAGARRMLPRGEWSRAETWALGGLRISVVDASGRTLPALRSGSRLVGVGGPGERYSLAIENSSGARYEIVASVDGLDVLDGESASFDKRGYLVGAYSSVLIDGFRRSEAEVAAFRMGDVARSYAARKGQARNVGVIGFALFEERRAAGFDPMPGPSRRWEQETRQRRDADAFPGRYARPPVW